MPSKTTAKVITASTPASVTAFPSSPYLVHALPTLDAAHQRTIAIAAGDLQVAVRREVQRLLEEHKGNPMGAVRVGLERLLSDGAISSSEFTALSEVCESVFAAERGKIDAKTAYQRTRTVYDQLLLDNGSSPIALATLSVLSAAYTSALSGASPGAVVLAAKSDVPGQIGIAGGLLIGGIIGGSIGGLGGAVIGGVVGGIVGGAVGICAS